MVRPHGLDEAQFLRFTMKNRLLLSATLIVLAVVLAALVGTTSAQQRTKQGDSIRRITGKPTRPVEMPAWSIPPPQILAPPHPATVYKVEPIPVRGIVQQRTPQQEEALKDASVVVAKARPIPAERIQFFAWMNAVDSPVAFSGWGVFIQSVVAVPEGRLITLRVSTLATRKDGGPVGVNNNFIEEYLWTSGRLQYVRGYCCPIIGSTPSISSL